ncbi:MAG: hypothetical protein AAGI09_11700 [Pseudomonadota bacterium]
MQTQSVLRALSKAAILSILAACGGSSGASMSLSNPDFFLGRVSEGVMTGSFNVAGFTSGEVRKLVSDACSAGLTAFGDQRGENGLSLFSATCAEWISDARLVEYQRTE